MDRKPDVGFSCALPIFRLVVHMKLTFKQLVFIFQQVLHHLEQLPDPGLPIAYLEHLIHDSRIGEIDSVFHNALIKLCLGRVRDLYADYLMTLPPGMVNLEEVALPSAFYHHPHVPNCLLCSFR